MARDDTSVIVRDFDRGAARGKPKDLSPDERLAQVARKPERLQIVDLDHQPKEGENFDAGAGMIQAQFNPAEFEELMRTDWARQKSPGLSHRRLQYVGTENVEISFTLTFDALTEGMTLEETLAARRFLRSLCYARRGATDVRSGQIPRVLFVWPSFLTLTGVITELAFKYERFDPSGACTRYTVRVKLEEITVEDQRIFLEDVRSGV